MAYARPFDTSAAIMGIAVGYANAVHTLIADDVLPKVLVAAEKFKWTFYPTAQMFTVPDTRVGRTGLVNRVSFTGEERSAAVDDYGLEDAIPISDIEEAETMRKLKLGSFDPELIAAAGLTNIILLDREVRTAAMVQDPANYTPERRLVLSGGDQLSDYENSDPIGVFKEAFRSTLVYRPNTMPMSRDTWSVISSHPHLVNAIRGNVTGRGIIKPAEFVDLFAGEGLRKLCIGEGFVNTARKGQPKAISRVWGSSIQLAFLDPTIRPEQGGVTWGFTGAYGPRIGGSWQDRNVGLGGGTVVRIGERVKELIVAKDVGFIIQNVIAPA